MGARLAPETGPIPKGRQKRPRKRDKAHLVSLHDLPRLITGSMPVQAAHLRSACRELGKRETGMAEKPDDIYVVPLCPEKHREQHSMNEIEFWKMHGFEWREVITIAMALHVNNDNLEVCQRIIQEARR